MQCPACSGPLEQLEKSGLVIDNCPACHGFWLDRGELEHMLARRASGHPDLEEIAPTLERLSRTEVRATGEVVLRCPRCAGTLGKLSFVRGDTTVIADRCAACGGIWLESGEMGLLFAIVERTRRGSGAAEPEPRARHGFGLGELALMLVAALGAGAILAALLGAFR